MAAERVVVVGAGIGGLVSALLLAQRGLRVTVVDAAHEPGGKIRRVMVDGAAIDSGPTVFTMRWIFDGILAAAGTSLERELQIQPLSVLARHFWEDGSQLDLFADLAASHDAVARLAGPAEAARFRAFCAQAREVYQTLEGPFIRSASPTMTRMVGSLGLRGLSVLTRLGPMRSLWDALAKHFHDPRMQQLFGRYATYCGSSPWEAPATLMLIAQVEMDGVWSVQGGMHALAQAMARLCQERGVEFRWGARCERIEITGGQASGVRLQRADSSPGGDRVADGERLPADRVVFNGDIAALAAGLLGPEARRTAPSVGPRSLSALTWSVHAESAGLALDRHNVFFRHSPQSDYRSEFADIFESGRLPRQPTVYVCAQDRGVGDAPPGANGDASAHGAGAPGTSGTAPGARRLLCLVNAPAVGGRGLITPEALAECESNTFSLLQHCGLTLSPQPHQVVRTTPDDFARLFPGSAGALYGQATHGWMSAFARSPSVSPVPGLFLAGGSVHPGPGVPMAAMSGQLAAAAVMDSLVSTRR